MSFAKYAPLALLLLAGCAARRGEFDETGGINSVRTPCPAVAVPSGTGDVTLFDPPASSDARAIDVVATITNLRSNCDTAAAGGSDVATNATFEVVATRRDAGPARDVVLPYFAVVVQGGDTVVAKRVSRVQVHFDAGQRRTVATASGASAISATAANLPPEIVDRLTRKRKPQDADASIDPLAAPDVRRAVARSTFELLIGFQLTPDQLRYNVTR